MDVKTAISLAKQQISDIFAEEDIKNLGLEEVDYDEAEHAWRITIGFPRPWDEPSVGAGANVLVFGRFGNAGPVGAWDALLVSAGPSCAA